MPEIEKTKTSRQEEAPSQLYLDALKAIESAPSKTVAIAKLTKELEELAASCGQSVKDLVHEAEFDGGLLFKEEHLTAISLARSIAILKK